MCCAPGNQKVKSPDDFGKLWKELWCFICLASFFHKFLTLVYFTEISPASKSAFTDNDVETRREMLWQITTMCPLDFRRNIIFARFPWTYRLPPNPGRVPWDLPACCPSRYCCCPPPAGPMLWASARPRSRVATRCRQRQRVWNQRLELLPPLDHSPQISKWARKDAQTLWTASRRQLWPWCPLGRGPKSVQAALSGPATHTQGWPGLLMLQCLCLMAEFRDSRQD